MLLELLEARLKGEGASDNPRELTLEKRYAYAHGLQADAKLTYYRGLTPTDEDKREFLKVMRTGDKIGPGLNRFVAGTLGLDPEWSLKESGSDVSSELLETLNPDDPNPPPPEDVTLATELNDLEDTLTVWDKAAGLHAKMRLLYRTSLWAEVGYARLYIPDSLKDDPRVQSRSFASVADALTAVYLNVIDPRSAGAVTDEHGDVLGYYYRYPDDEAEDKHDVLELHTPTEVKEYRPSVDGKLRDALENRTPDVPPNPLYREGQRPDYLMTALTHPTGGALDESIIDEQDSLNESKVEMRRNGRMGGYRQYITVNASEPTNEAGETVPYKFGPSVVANVNGYPYMDAKGEEVIGITTPSVVIVEPVNPETFITQIRHHTFEILQRWNQSHFEAAFLAVSGESKRESKEAWETLLELEAGPVGEVYARILRNALRLAYWLTGANDAAFDKYEVYPRLKLAVSASDMTTTMQASELVTRGHMTLDAFVDVSPLITNKESQKADLRRQRETTQTEPEPPP